MGPLHFSKTFRQFSTTAQLFLIIGTVSLGFVSEGCYLAPKSVTAKLPGTSAAAGTASSQRYVWPNAISHTNGDAWLQAHHSEVTELHPNVLILFANNTDTLAHVQSFANTAIAAFKEGSRYHGYKDATAKPQLIYTIAKIADMRDGAATAWPAAWPLLPAAVPTGSDFIYEGLFTQAFAVHYGYVDPADNSRYLTLCDLFEKGIVNELWVAGPRGSDGNPLGVYESKARIAQYDASTNPTGVFNSCAGNGCYDPGTAGLCKVSVRLMELATDRGPGCATHATGHGMEGLTHAIPYYATNSSRFYGFHLDTRYGLSFTDLYDCNSLGSGCWAYPTDHTLARSPAGGAPVADFTFSPWGEGCGNVHFPSNATGQYDYTNNTQVLSTCADYGGHHGVNGKDAQTEYSANLVAAYDQLYGDCGGGWQIYMRQSMPGYGNGGTGDDGKPLLSWWPFLYY